MAVSSVTMKLLIDTKTKRVVFAEAGKECVDFLFHILSLPIGSVIRLLTTKEMAGSLGNLYESLENLDNMFIQPNQNKDTFLKPKSPSYSASFPLLSLDNSPEFFRCGDCDIDESAYVTDDPQACCPQCGGYMDKELKYVAPPTGNKVSTKGGVAKEFVEIFYRCSDCDFDESNYVTDDSRAQCPSCRRCMDTELEYVAPPPEKVGASSNGGMVKGVVTYMVLDDLVVKPMSTISSITLLNKFSIRDVGVLQEKVVTLGKDEALKLLKSSLQSKNVLTSVFMDYLHRL